MAVTMVPCFRCRTKMVLATERYCALCYSIVHTDRGREEVLSHPDLAELEEELNKWYS